MRHRTVRELMTRAVGRDSAIRAEIVEDVVSRALGGAPSAVGVTGEKGGGVVLTGSVSRRSVVPVLERLCRGVDGVVPVDQRPGWDEDGT